MRVVVTRPEADAPGWAQGLQAAGLDPLLLPLIDIGPVTDPQAVQALHQAWQQVSHCTGVMFVSGNAVAHFFAQKPAETASGQAWPAIKNRAWATGPGTVRALLRAGVAARWIDSPDHEAGQFDSEALWTVVQSQVQPGDQVLIVRGADAVGTTTQGAGRDWFAAKVAAAGGQVHFAVAYQRAAPVFTDVQQGDAQAAAVDGSVWLFSSSEAIANLQVWLPQQSWGDARAVATHARIAAAAKQLGFGVVCESRPLLASVVASIESLG